MHLFKSGKDKLKIIKITLNQSGYHNTLYMKYTRHSLISNRKLFDKH